MTDEDFYGELIARKSETKVYNVFASDYHLIATFICPYQCKNWLKSPDSRYVPAWVGVFTANKIMDAVPMWLPHDFINDYPHKN